MDGFCQLPFGMSSTIWDTRGQAPTTLGNMSVEISEKEIKDNLRACLKACMDEGKFGGPADLMRLVIPELEKLAAQHPKSAKLKKTISDQTASNWIQGRVIPDWYQLAALAAAVGVPGDQLLFGSRRGEQLKKEREYLTRVSEEEMKLLTAYREANKSAQKTILKQARVVADDHPAPEASVHQLRRKDDKLKA